ncbi:MAG: DUF4382 domain-containing protein [Deltaproteobacteria bacterium]|nr:MAG: DUF4382 domain-containing protein [Deltaproteobacteria bacterium]
MRRMFLAAGLVMITACGGMEQSAVGTVVFTANGEEFVRNGFTSEDGWAIQFDAVYVNVYGPTAYQVVEAEQPLTLAGLRHGGHPHENIPEGSAHVALTGDYFLQLKQPVFEVGRVEDAPIGNYNRLAFTVRPATAESEGIVDGFDGVSLAFVGTAEKEGRTIQFDIRFDEQMAYYDCGPNGDAGVLAEGGEATAEMTFHVDHVFGDVDAGPPDTTDETSVNFMAVGFEPFAALAQGDNLVIDQQQLGQVMNGATYLQLIDAVRTMGHSGEAHCHLD